MEPESSHAPHYSPFAGLPEVLSGTRQSPGRPHSWEGNNLPGPTGPSLQTSLFPPTPPQWLQEGPDWESASVACWRAPGMLIHGSQELPVKYAELGYGLCLFL